MGIWLYLILLLGNLLGIIISETSIYDNLRKGCTPCLKDLVLKYICTMGLICSILMLHIYSPLH